MSNIAKRIAALSPEQRKLLELRLKQKQINSISPRKASDTLYLSSMQKGLWLAHQLQPDLPLYNESSLFKLTGKLDIDALEKSINQIINRHEILRTSFQVIKERVTQVIATELIISVLTIDLTGCSQAKREAEIQSIVNRYSQQPFDLEQLPLLRSIIITLSDQEHLMLITMHHLISDGWSWGVFCRELATFYQALSLPELPIQYGDFVLWHRQLIQDKITPQLDYWQQKLKNAPLILELPTDYPRPAKQSFQGGREIFIIPQQLSKKLKALSTQENVTLFMLLLAAFKTLLYRYSQQTDIVVGTPVANRDRTETENLIGCFINTIVLRTNLDREPSFLELLQRVKATTLAAYNHQDLPFEELVEKLKVERSQAINPLFQVMFVYQEAPLLSLSLPDLKITPLPIDNGIAKFDLTLYIEDTKEELIGFLEYSSDLFRRDTIERMWSNFHTLLTEIVANPHTKIDRLPLLTASARNKLLLEWNNTQRDYPLDLCLHQLFENQVTKTPDAVAVVFEDRHLTYKELNNKADRLANYLQQLGVDKDSLVGICLERSLLMTIALLAVLKAGGAYVPLDPTYPLERLNFMVEDAGLKIILTQEKLRGHLATDRLKEIELDTDWETIVQHSQTLAQYVSQPESLAYVIYTSGSTGKPKGVQIGHRQVVNFLTSMSFQPGCDRQDILLAVTSISFDIAVLEIFLPLIVGAKVILVSREVALDSQKLLSALDRYNPTIMQATPATWQLLLEAGWQGSDRLKTLCGGEALKKTLAQQLLSKVASLWNMYGPTETTIWSAIEPVQRNSTDNSIPIGQAIANTQIYILDRHLQPLPIGVPGELYIAGIGVAKGYLNRPELTAEKFIPNPFLVNSNNDRSYASTSLLYKTGDKARYLASGKIEYLGRIDNQVKIRGFRIEIGEIESALTQHDSVREVVVILQEDDCQQKSLVAYIVFDWETPTVQELRCFLSQQLPEYMIPNTFMGIDILPLTPNGKIDRRALTHLNARPIGSKENYTAANTTTQEILVGVWSQILNLDRVGVDDNFFEIGGHSLLATQVISQVRKTFKVEIPLGELFSAPTIAQFSQRVEKAIASKENLDILSLKPVDRNSNLPLSFAQQRLWLLQQLEAKSTAYNGSNALIIDGNINLEVLTASINEIIKRHEILRTSFELIDGQAVQKIVDELKISLAIIDLQNLSETEQQTEVKRLTVIDAQKPFVLNQAPLLRLSLIKLEAEKHILLVTMHHIISDAWSAGIFMREISALYTAFSTEKSSPLPELLIQYVDFAVWQQQWLQGEVLDNQLAYWKRQLRDAQTTIELPRDKFSNEITSIGKQYNFSLTCELSQQLEIFSQQQQVTLFMTLLTIFNTLLYSYTQQEDILVGSPIANRNRSEIEGLIGFFVNTLVLRTDLSNEPSFSELLQRVREVALGAYAHQDLPFEKLVSELKPERYRDRSPLFQVWFVLQNAPTAELKLSGLNLTLVDVESGIVRHDLKLDITKTDLGITGFFEYKQDLFSESAIATMAARFQILIALVIEQPELKLDELIKAAIETEQKQQKLISDRFKNQQIKQLSKFKRQAINKD